jgi:hypothetical protein
MAALFSKDKIFNTMSTCGICTKLSPLTKPAAGCKPTKPKITDVRLFCEEDVVETFSASVDAVCTNGFISNMVSADPIGDPTPIKAFAIFNQDELDETNSFTFDRATDTGEDTYTLAIGVKIYTPGNECVLNSLKGQDLSIVFKIDNLDGNFIWRRFKGKLTAVEGGLIAGYTLTFDIVNPSDIDAPKYVNFSTAAATTTGLNLITQFV